MSWLGAQAILLVLSSDGSYLKTNIFWFVENGEKESPGASVCRKGKYHMRGVECGVIQR